ncbi:MAG: DNA polymerase III subunit delta [Clostridia bacterium]|nr:DNA polymerase III subunit delta [Clostridia bacterium]
MDTAELKNRIKDGTLSGVYLFCGEEEYLSRYYSRELISAVGDDSPFAVFNNLSYDGEDVDFAAIKEATKSPPMMSDYKLVVWRHADLTSLTEAECEALSEIAELVNEGGYAVVVLVATATGVEFGTPKKPSAFISRFDKKINVLRYDKSSENQLYSWLKKHFDKEGLAVTLDTVKTLVFRSGRSMEVLANEVKKLSALAHARGKGQLTPSDVIEAASTTPESDTYALSNAINDRNKEKAYDALMDMKHRRVEPQIIVGMMSRSFSELLSVALLLDDGRGSQDIESILKINPYRLKHAISAAKKYTTARLLEIVDTLAKIDAESKFGGVAGYTMIELFISQNL